MKVIISVFLENLNQSLVSGDEVLCQLDSKKLNVLAVELNYFFKSFNQLPVNYFLNKLEVRF
jgi:hypothetical protein